MRRLCLILPLAMPILFHWIYQPINESWTVKRFGCGCPPIRGDGGGLNANHFNLILWGIIVLFCGAAWLMFLQRAVVNRTSHRYLFAQAVGIVIVTIICTKFFTSELWL